MINWGGLVHSSYNYNEMLLLAKNFEKWNFSTFWYPDEKYFRDCFIGLTVAALNTKQIRLGPCVVDPFLRHPIQIAVSIGSLAEIAPERVVLGFGAGGRGLAEIGIKQYRPVKAIRESIFVIKRLLEGETVNYLGQTFKIENLPLDFEPPGSIPIMIATGHGPLIQQLAGEIGDIVMLANLCTPNLIKNSLNLIEKGSKKSKRSIEDIEIIARIDIAISDDKYLARKAVSPRIISALRSSYPGLAYLDYLPEIQMSSRLLNALKKKDYESKKYYSNPENSVSIIPDGIYENLSIAGNSIEVAQKLIDIAKMNIFKEITVSIIPTEEQTLFAAYDKFVKEVMPLI